MTVWPAILENRCVRVLLGDDAITFMASIKTTPVIPDPWAHKIEDRLIHAARSTGVIA